MKLAIVAATGGVGRHVLLQAMAAGHDVTAVVRDPTRVSSAVRIVKVNLRAPDSRSLDAAVDEADAVLSCLGPRSKEEAGIASLGTSAIVRAMHRMVVRRIVAVSAAPVGTVPSPGRPYPPKHDPGDGFIMRHVLSPLVKGVFGWHYADLAMMEEVLRESGLDWTIIRPPRLTNGSLTSNYRTAYGRNLPRGLAISRADVSQVMLRVLDRPGTIKEVIGVAN